MAGLPRFGNMPLMEAVYDQLRRMACVQLWTGINLLALDLALQKLMALDERQARLVELQFIGGLTLEEAHTWLNRELRTEAS